MTVGEGHDRASIGMEYLEGMVFILANGWQAGAVTGAVQLNAPTAVSVKSL